MADLSSTSREAIQVIDKRAFDPQPLSDLGKGMSAAMEVSHGSGATHGQLSAQLSKVLDSPS